MSEKSGHIPFLCRRLRLAIWVVLLSILLPEWCPAETKSKLNISNSDIQSLSADSKFTQEQLREETLDIANDELIMLMISLVVVIQIMISFKFLKWIQRSGLLLCSFGFLLLSAFCTVAESLLLTETLNYLEHISLMTSSLLLAFWCWHVFGAKKQEDG